MGCHYIALDFSKDPGNDGKAGDARRYIIIIIIVRIYLYGADRRETQAGCEIATASEWAQTECGQTNGRIWFLQDGRQKEINECAVDKRLGFSTVDNFS